MSDRNSALTLVFRTGAHICALPLCEIAEIMRPLPVETLAGAPAAVRGFSIVRGLPVPVIDLDGLLGACNRRSASRYIVVRAGERRIALSVDSVVGIREFEPSVWRDLPPLLGEAPAELVEAVGALDGHALLALNTGTIVPEAVWDALAGEAAQ